MAGVVSATRRSDRTGRGRRDTNRISLNDELEVRYWTARCEVGKDSLLDAIAAVGTNIHAVLRFLEKSSASRR